MWRLRRRRRRSFWRVGYDLNSDLARLSHVAGDHRAELSKNGRRSSLAGEGLLFISRSYDDPGGHGPAHGAAGEIHDGRQSL